MAAPAEYAETVKLADLLTYEEAAAELGIKVGAIKAAIVSGRLHPVKLPGSRAKFLRREEIADYERTRYARRGPASATSAPLVAPISHEELAARVRILSEPTLTALREGQATLREGLDNLRSIAVATALGLGGVTPQGQAGLAGEGATRGAEGTLDPKR